jgi:hypothetical protein
MAIKLQGPWRAGWALDLHVLSSVLRGDGTYDTVRSELGQKLFELKYRNAREHVEPLAEAARDSLEPCSCDPIFLRWSRYHLRLHGRFSRLLRWRAQSDTKPGFP